MLLRSSPYHATRGISEMYDTLDMPIPRYTGCRFLCAVFSGTHDVATLMAARKDFINLEHRLDAENSRMFDYGVIIGASQRNLLCHTPGSMKRLQFFRLALLATSPDRPVLKGVQADIHRCSFSTIRRMPPMWMQAELLKSLCE